MTRAHSAAAAGDDSAASTMGGRKRTSSLWALPPDSQKAFCRPSGQQEILGLGQTGEPIARTTLLWAVTWGLSVGVVADGDGTSTSWELPAACQSPRSSAARGLRDLRLGEKGALPPAFRLIVPSTLFTLSPFMAFMAAAAGWHDRGGRA